MSQESRILKYLKEGNTLTPLEALKHFGCLRLGARVYELKKQGYNIVSELTEDLSTGKRFSEYSLTSDKI